MNKLWKICFLLLTCLIATICTQNWGISDSSPLIPAASLNLFQSISKGAEEFSLDLLTTLAKEIAGVKNNVMISPFSVWALLLLITEGAGGETLKELQNTLRITNNSLLLREGYKLIQKSLKINTSTVEVASLQAIFHDMNRPLFRSYEDIVVQQYEADLVPISFFNIDQAVTTVTKYIENATQGSINPSLSPNDFEDAQMLMISSLYFKGKWKLPFNASFTREEPFYDDDDNVIARVQMMTQTAVFNYAPIVDLQSHILELPYGTENRLSMLLIVPKKGVRLNAALENLQKLGLKRVFDELSTRERNMDEYDGDDVEVFLPKFISTSSITLNAILEKMGIRDVFQPSFANLTRLSDQAIYLSRLIHQTKIEVNEEGTVAAAITSGVFANKASPPRFMLNRPFGFLIVEKTTRSLLFCGQIAKPSYVK